MLEKHQLKPLSHALSGEMVVQIADGALFGLGCALVN